MVTNGDRKTNNFGKLVRQKVGLFSSWLSAGTNTRPIGSVHVATRGTREGYPQAYKACTVVFNSEAP